MHLLIRFSFYRSHLCVGWPACQESGIHRHCSGAGVSICQGRWDSVVKISLGCFCWGLISNEVVEDRKGEVRTRACSNKSAASGWGLR